jgi:hypothetical protein
VTATDEDGDEITYVLGGGAGSKFKINNKTGEVFLNAFLTKQVKYTPFFIIFLGEASKIDLEPLTSVLYIFNLICRNIQAGSVLRFSLMMTSTGLNSRYENGGCDYDGCDGDW